MCFLRWISFFCCFTFFSFHPYLSLSFSLSLFFSLLFSFFLFFSPSLSTSRFRSFSVDANQNIPNKSRCIQMEFYIPAAKLVTLNESDNGFSFKLYTGLFVRFLSEYHSNPFQKKARKVTPIVLLFTYSICQIEVKLKKAECEQKAKKGRLECHLCRTHSMHLSI